MTTLVPTAKPKRVRKTKYSPGAEVQNIAEFMIHYIKKGGFYHNGKYQGWSWVQHWTLRWIQASIKSGHIRIAVLNEQV